MTRIEMTDADRAEVAAFVERHWGSTRVMSRGKSYYPHELEALLERRDGALVGLLTYRIEAKELEILTVNSTLSGQGIGSALILDSIEVARHRQCEKVWLTTTNDNLRAIGLYQRLGFRMVAIAVGAVDEARLIKPEIPEHGERGIAIHDEIVMELPIKPYIDD